jgi:hypothetical protein
MTKRDDKVILVVPQHNMEQEFEVSHAERLLRMKRNGGWVLPSDSKFEFNQTNGIKRRGNKANPEEPKSEE